MPIFKPFMYKKNIYEIDYKKLKDMGVKCLIFDLDNTLGLISHKECPKDTKELIKKLKKDFTIFISSNNSEVRIKPYLDELEIEGVSFSLKPFTRSFRKIRRKKFFKREEMVMIGDQIVTDILAGNRYKIKTILVDALGEKDLKITKLNRFIENKIVKRYQKKGLFERGKYYE